MQKLQALLYTNNEKSEREIRETIACTTEAKGITMKKSERAIRETIPCTTAAKRIKYLNRQKSYTGNFSVL